MRRTLQRRMSIFHFAFWSCFDAKPCEVPVFSVVSWLVLALRVDAGHYKILLVCFRDVWEVGIGRCK